MFVAGIDAHATYSVIAIVSNTGQLVHGSVRIKNTEEERLDELLEQYRPPRWSSRRVWLGRGSSIDSRYQRNDVVGLVP